MRKNKEFFKENHTSPLKTKKKEKEKKLSPEEKYHAGKEG